MTAPLASLDEWEDDLRRRYPLPADSKPPGEETAFRDYRAEARAGVKEFYRLNHNKTAISRGSS